MELVKPEGKRLIWQPRLRWEHNIKIGLKEIISLDWVQLAQERIQWQAVMNTMKR
jgi:hypothetical protein